MLRYFADLWGEYEKKRASNVWAGNNVNRFAFVRLMEMGLFLNCVLVPLSALVPPVIPIRSWLSHLSFVSPTFCSLFESCPSAITAAFVEGSYMHLQPTFVSWNNLMINFILNISFQTLIFLSFCIKKFSFFFQKKFEKSDQRRKKVGND